MLWSTRAVLCFDPQVLRCSNHLRRCQQTSQPSALATSIHSPMSILPFLMACASFVSERPAPTSLRLPYQRRAVFGGDTRCSICLSLSLKSCYKCMAGSVAPEESRGCFMGGDDGWPCLGPVFLDHARRHKKTDEPSSCLGVSKH